MLKCCCFYEEATTRFHSQSQDVTFCILFGACFSYPALQNEHEAKISQASSQPQLFYLAHVSENSTWLLESSQREKIAFPEGRHSFPCLFCIYITQLGLCFLTVHTHRTHRRQLVECHPNVFMTLDVCAVGNKISELALILMTY